MSEQPSGEKTEQATPKRKRDAREKGQVVKSADVVVAFSLIVMFGALTMMGTPMIENMRRAMNFFFSTSAPATLSQTDAVILLRNIVLQFLKTVAPILGVALLCGIVANVAQTGLLFSTKALEPKLEKISMLSGFKRIFSMKTLIELVKGLLKLTVIAWAAYSEYRSHMNEFPNLMYQDLRSAVPTAAKMILSIAIKLGIAFAVLAPLDYLYQWRKFNKDLMMTKEEVRQEYKQMEGNPQTKSRIAQKRRQMSRTRMIQAVKEADVIITNPTHYAVALSYQESRHKAPVVVAKGKDYLAQRIKERAKELDVAIVENKGVARSLYFLCEIGDEVPEDMYKAIAEILAYVYRLKKRARG